MAELYENKSNSYRYKEEQKNKAQTQEKRVEKPVVTGKVVAKKKSVLSKFTEEFISEDAKNVKSYVFGEVLIPAIKKAISDIVTDGIDMILYGGSRGDRKRSTADRVSYRNYYDNRARDTRPVTATRYTTDDIILATRSEAEDVLDRMYELLDTYKIVRVADLYDLVGITGSYTDNNYGWTSLRGADIVRVRDGYIIKMPRAMPID